MSKILINIEGWFVWEDEKKNHIFSHILGCVFFCFINFQKEVVELLGVYSDADTLEFRGTSVLLAILTPSCRYCLAIYECKIFYHPLKYFLDSIKFPFYSRKMWMWGEVKELWWMKKCCTDWVGQSVLKFATHCNKFYIVSIVTPLNLIAAFQYAVFFNSKIIFSNWV